MLLEHNKSSRITMSDTLRELIRVKLNRTGSLEVGIDDLGLLMGR
jgi:hypothetical protein